MNRELGTHVARGFKDRLVGLAWTRSPRASALLLPHCRSVQTFGMRFPLDLFWLDARGEVIRVDRSVPPGRVVRCAGARCVVEVPASPASRPGDAAAATAT